MRLFLVPALVFLFSVDHAFAKYNGPVFRAKTNDLTVDDKCESYKPSYFLKADIKYFLVGISGTKRAGFHEEIALTRDHARVLWAAFNPNAKPNKREQAMRKIVNNDQLAAYYDVLEEGKEARGAQYYSEGEVLEVLSYKLLPESETFRAMVMEYFGRVVVSEDEFFITGGISYHSKSGQTVGELDVVVGDAQTCSVFAIGEAKLGGKKSKAVRQLDRIKQFLRSL